MLSSQSNIGCLYQRLFEVVLVGQLGSTDSNRIEHREEDVEGREKRKADVLRLGMTTSSC
jgi:hypothetical protein